MPSILVVFERKEEAEEATAALEQKHPGAAVLPASEAVVAAMRAGQKGWSRRSAAIDTVTALVVGLRALEADLRTRATDAAEVNRILDEYVERLMHMMQDVADHVMASP